MSVILWTATILLLLSAGAGSWVIGRRVVRKATERRTVKRAAKVRKSLEASRRREYDDLEQILFQLKGEHPVEVISEQMYAELHAQPDAPPIKLVHAFETLGYTDRLLRDVREDTSWEVRAHAAKTLGLLRVVRAVSPLIAAMRDEREDPDVKLACGEALALIRDPRAIPILCEELGTGGAYSSPRVAQVLASFGQEAVTPLLKTLDSAQDADARVWAAQILGGSGDRRAVMPLVERLHSRSEKLRLAACSALAELKDARAVMPLIQVILRDPMPAVRTQAAGALGDIGDPGALPLLVSALGDPEDWMRSRALAAIEALAPKDTSMIEGALRDPNRDVRWRAALALERLGKLEGAFDDLASNNDQRVDAAIERLVAVGRSGLSERLVRYLADDNPRVRARIASVLGAVGNRDHARELLPVLEDPDEDVRIEAIAALGSLHAAETAPALMPFLDLERGREREAAVEALRRYPGTVLKLLVSDLTAMASDASDEMRAAAIRVLSMASGGQARACLSDGLSDPHGNVRLESVRALADRGDESHVPMIGECLTDSHAQIRLAAAEALGKIGGREAVNLLINSVPHAGSDERDAICAALAALGFDAISPALDILLAADDMNSRLGAIWTLGKTATTDERAVKMLALLLEDSEPRIRASVAGALGKIHSEISAEALLASVADPDQYARAAIVNALGSVGTTEMVPGIAGAFSDPDAFVRNRVALALGRLGGERAGDAIANADAKGSVDVEFAVIAYGLCGTAAGISGAVEMLRDPALREHVEVVLEGEPAPIRQQFLRSLRLGARGPVSEAPPEGDGEQLRLNVEVLNRHYVQAIRRSQQADVRHKAAAALASCEDQDALEALGDALRHDPDPAVRRCAANALLPRGEQESPKAALLSAVHDPDPEVRVVAMRAVGSYGDTRDVPRVFAALTSTQPRVALAAAETLATLCADGIDELHDVIMAAPTDEQRIAGLRVLARLADVRSLPLLAHLIHSGNPEVRLGAARVLAQFRVPAAVAPLLDALKDPNQAVRLAVLKAVGEFRRPGIAASLEVVCNDPSPEVRARLAQVLTDREDDAAANSLLEQLANDSVAEVASNAILGLLLCSPESDGPERFLGLWDSLNPMAQELAQAGSGRAVVRMDKQLRTALKSEQRLQAIRVLATLGAEEHWEIIAVALRDPDADIRLAAVEVLGELSGDEITARLRELQDDPVSAVRAAAKRHFIKSV